MSFENDEDHIREFFNFFQIDDEAFVTQTFKGEDGASGKVLVDNADDLIEEANKHTAEGLICLSANPRDDTEGGVPTVSNLNQIPIDIDVEGCVREEGVSPQQWKDEAKDVVREVTKDLEDLGLSRDLLVDSGNGFHLYVGIDVDMPDVESPKEWRGTEAHDKLSELESRLEENNIEKEVLVEEDGEMVEEERTVIKVDTLTTDIARRMKIAGTHNVKDEIPEKNYRMAEILDIQEPDRESNSEALMDIKVQEDEDQTIVDSFSSDPSGSDLSDREKIERVKEHDSNIWKSFGDDRSERDKFIAAKAAYYRIDLETALEELGSEKLQQKTKNGYRESYLTSQRKVYDRVNESEKVNWEDFETIDLDLDVLGLAEEDTEDEEEFDLEYPDGHFTERVMKLMRPDGIKQTPCGYEFSAGLFLLAVSTDQNYREGLRNQQPNVAVSYLGQSNVGKSFPKHYARTILGNTFIGPKTLKDRNLNDATPESILKNDMNTYAMDDEDYEERGREKEKRFFLSEEASSFWDSMDNEKGMSTFLTQILEHRGREGDEVTKSTVTGKGKNGPRRPFLNIFAGTQVNSFENIFTSDSVKQGIVGRLYLVDNIGNFSQTLKPSDKKQPPFYDADLIDQRERICRRLSAIHFIGDIHNMWGIDMTEEATELYDSWILELLNRDDVSGNEVYQSVIGKTENKILKTALLMQIGSEEFYQHVTDYIQALCRRKNTDCSSDEWRNVLDNGTRSGLEERADKSDMKDDKFKITEEAMRAAIYYHAELFIPSMFERLDEMMGEDSEERKVYEFAKRNADPVEGYDGYVIRHRDFEQSKFNLSLNKDLSAIKKSLENMGYVAKVDAENNTSLYEKLNDKKGRNAEYVFIREKRSKTDIPHRGNPTEIKTKDFLDF